MCVCVCVEERERGYPPSSFSAAIAIKESVHVGDKSQKRLARGVDDLGMCYRVLHCTCTAVDQSERIFLCV